MKETLTTENTYHRWLWNHRCRTQQADRRSLPSDRCPIGQPNYREAGISGLDNGRVEEASLEEKVYLAVVNGSRRASTRGHSLCSAAGILFTRLPLGGIVRLGFPHHLDVTAVSGETPDRYKQLL